MSNLDTTKRDQLLRDGFCVFPQALPAELIAQMRATTTQLLEGEAGAHSAQTHRSQGSMLTTDMHPDFADLIGAPALLDALAQLGYAHPTFTDGYIISKPGRSPRLFWHYDWFAWQDPASWQAEPPQLFAMIYLSDTRRENGCLRAIPGSHIRENPLHTDLAAPHSRELADARDLTRPEFSDRPDETDIPVQTGDLVIGDARLLHAAHANTTDARRTLITLWYQPDFAALPARVQAQMQAKAQDVSHWPGAAREKIEPLLPRYEGKAAPYERALRETKFAPR